MYIRAGTFLMFEHVRTFEPVRTFERARPFELFEHQKGSIRLEIMAGKNARAF